MFERTGGVQQVIQHLHDGLTKKGHVVKVITQRPSGFEGDVPQDYILFGVVRNFKGGMGTQGNWGMPSDGEEISQILEREDFDVINFHEPWMPILAWQMLKHSKAAHVGTFHANLIDTAAAKSWVNVFLPYGRGIGQKMHVLTAVSPAPASLLVSKAEKDFEKKLIENMKYIPNGIDLGQYKPPKKRLPLNGPNTKTALYVGRLESRKGVEYLLRAVIRLQELVPSCYLIIAGEGPQRSKLEQMTKSLRLKNVRFTGYVDENEKKRLMGNADLLVSPATHGESFGIVLIEGMAMGVPVMGGRNSGYINVLSGHGQLGLVDPKSTEDFAQRMAVFMTDEKIAGLLRGWGLSDVKKYNYSKIIDQYEAAYKEAIKLRDEKQNPIKAKKKDETGSKKIIRRVFIRRHTR